MSNKVFANACYGVILGEDDQQLLSGTLDDICEDPNYAGADEDVWLGKLQEVLKDELELIKQAYGDPNAHFIYTGPEDQHSPGSAVSFETWILGYGCMAFPEKNGSDIPEKFRKAASWLFWVSH